MVGGTNDGTVEMEKLGRTSKDTMRSIPQQERSRIRKELLLNAVEEIIQKTGLDGLGMREVARKTGLPISSIHHYFPAKAAMIRELAVRHFDEIRQIIFDALDTASSQQQSNLAPVIDVLIDHLHDYFIATPALAAIIRATHADPELRLLNHEDSLRNAVLLVPLLEPLLPPRASTTAIAVARLLIEITASSLLLALEAPSDAGRVEMLSALKLILRMTIAGGGRNQPSQP